MRHGKKFNHLSRKSAHRKAMLSNMACSLIEHKRINTTVAKAKALRKYVEPLITRSKEDSTHSRRVCFRYLGNKYAVNELFREVAPKVSEREGGYTRIIRTGYRLGDSAEMCMIELVDFNELYSKEEKKKSRTRRSRRGGAKKKTEETSQATEAASEDAAKAADEKTEDTSAEAPKAEEAPKSEDTKENDTPKAEGDNTAEGDDEKKEG
jgi:large subunit ribosomal protein L17